MKREALSTSGASDVAQLLQPAASNTEAQRDRTIQRLREDEVIVDEALELLNVALVVPMESA